jgi:hypothetical protein
MIYCHDIFIADMTNNRIRKPKTFNQHPLS